MPLTPGHRLGSYEIVCALGAGGMGEVYRALDTRLGREVALKILPADFAGDPESLARFDREARTIATLNHPHIVTLYSSEDAGGIRFLTMELVEGGTLSSMIPPGGMAVATFLEIAVPLSDALAAAHQKQITHRDLKPGNVMVSVDGRVKVLDFGLARVERAESSDLAATQAALTQQGVIIGTVPYMSPEQVEGRAIDARSDLFSLGVIFYEMLSGTRPFEAPSSAALMSAILRDTPLPLGDRRPDLPARLARLIKRLLEKRPDDRIQTARDVHNELRDGRSDGRSDNRSDNRSIAVLPFTDLSEKKDQEWFCDGVAEEILNALSPLSGLRVAARASSFSFKGKSDDLRSIAEKLNVETVLEGSVRRHGDRVRITAQLSDTREGRQLWSERFDRELKDIFDVQEDIARAIVGRLRVTLSGDAPLVNRPTANIEAYELLLKGRTFLYKRGRAVLDAIPLFEHAIALDPTLSEGHALLGDAHRLLGLYGLVPAADSLAKAHPSLSRALEHDPNQTEALATLANIKYAFEWNYEASRQLTDRALQIDPNHVRALAENVAMTATALADPPPPHLVEQSRARLTRARALDPLSAWLMAMAGMFHVMVREHDAALDLTARAIETDPGNYTAHWIRVVALAAAGMDGEARLAADAACVIFNRQPMILAELAALAAARGDRAAAEAIHAELQSAAGRSYLTPAPLAAVAASAGRLDEARRILAQAIAERDPFLVFFKFPSWRPLRADAQCESMLREAAFIKNALT